MRGVHLLASPLCRTSSARLARPILRQGDSPIPALYLSSPALRMASSSAPLATHAAHDEIALSPIEAAKRQASYRAVKEHFPPDARYVGIGSGSTVVYVVEAIAAMGTDVTSRITFVPTGFQSRELIVEAGLPLGGIDSMVPAQETRLKMSANAVRVATGQQDMALGGARLMLDVAFDGADEVDEQLNCIKGGGACLFQEKLVATSARKFVCVAGKQTALVHACLRLTHAL